MDVEIEFGQLFFEELQLCDHGVDEQIKSRIVAADSQALLSRVSERLGLGGVQSAPVSAYEQALESAQRKPKSPLKTAVCYGFLFVFLLDLFLIVPEIGATLQESKEN